MTRELPSWKCHKTVQADRIASYEMLDHGGRMRWTMVLDCGAEVLADAGYMTRVKGGDPVGGYFVRYADGYESWSPAQAFEDGYTKEMEG